METIRIERPYINLEALDERLRAELGSVVVGVSTGGGNVLVHVRDNTADDQRQHIRKLVLQHDPTQLTDAQSKRIRAQETLKRLKTEAEAQPLDGEQAPTVEAVLKGLTAKVRWLEAEIRALREA